MTVPPRPDEATPSPESFASASPQLPIAPPVIVAPPPSFGKQMGQLVIIPAVIVVICIGLAALFGKMAGATETLDNQLAKLRQSSGQGRMAFDLQDPRYKDRGLAAYSIAAMIPSIKDPRERSQLSRSLIEILDKNVGPEEDNLRVYLLTAIGQLGQDDALTVIAKALNSPRPVVRAGAIRGILSWPDLDQARAVVPQLNRLLADESPIVAAQAAVAVGALAKPGDADAIHGLAAALESSDNATREVRWNAAVALARLGDLRGSRVVAEQLLSREQLAKMPRSETEPSAGAMPPAMQEHMILSTLASADRMTDPAVWARIADLAQHDPSIAVRSAARQLVLSRKSR